MELLHMKIFHLLVDTELDFLRFPKHKTDLDFLRFPNHKTGWGVRYPSQGIFTPTLYS